MSDPVFDVEMDAELTISLVLAASHQSFMVCELPVSGSFGLPTAIHS